MLRDELLLCVLCGMSMFLLSVCSGGGELSWLEHMVCNPGVSYTNPGHAITFSCAAIHFPAASSKARSSHMMPIWCWRLKIP